MSLHFVPPSLPYHRGLRACAWACGSPVYWCRPAARPTCPRVTVSHSQPTRCSPPLLSLWLLHLDLIIVMSWMVNFITMWFFSTWAMGLHSMIFSLGERAYLLLSLSKGGWTDLKF